MASDLQLLVDQLSARVGAATLLEDHEQRPVVYSRQLGPIDAVRRDSILHRSTSPELMSWFRSFGILGSRRALRIPAHPELDILARVCAPAWYRDRLLGVPVAHRRRGSHLRQPAGRNREGGGPRRPHAVRGQSWRSASWCRR